MKPIVVFAALALSALMFVDAWAQDTNSTSNSEPPAGHSERIPSLVIHDAPAPSLGDKNAPVAELKAQGAPTKNAASKSTAGALSVPPATQPLVLSPVPASTGGQITTGNSKYDELVAMSAARNGVDPNLIVAVMRQESGFNPSARSYKGAVGLMQLLPATARRFGVVNIFDPAQNIEGGARYLRFLLDTFSGDVDLTLAGYNAGENAVVNSGYRVPRYRETQNYVRSISARYDAGKKETKRAAPGSSAPSAAVFSGGAASSRLSNNY
jgi:soluble lytic murein transglycosylase-like protein